ncbi:diguanylate cyclase [Poriferisphaera sp. WC338]|uniref:GGDEF domain-containing response regulator n=1 Tax=Poriferisphaera sp. WC338 TaxID=3425129 RepID=UPI003D81BCC4
MEGATPRILLVEDDPDTSLLIQETLQDHFGEPCVTVYPTVESSQEADLTQVDLVLSDMNLPDGSGLEVLEHYLAKRKDIPVVLVTAEGILENAIKAVRMGAYDYIMKTGDYLFALPVVVEKNLEIWRTKTENQHLQSRLEATLGELRLKNNELQVMVNKLENIAATDPLTGLANRRAFGRALNRYFANAIRNEEDIACLMIDLDGFKALNDTLGHPTGDRMLQLTARVLERFVRKSDIAGRFGGDEFVLLLPNTDQFTAHQVAQRIKETFEEEVAHVLDGEQFCVRLSMSLGLTTLEKCEAKTPQQLISFADQALYTAKKAGKTQIVVYNPEQQFKSAV